MIDLSAFLARYAARPFAWGTDDCSLILADWWQANHGGEDPAAHLRGSYGDETSCHALLRREGGLVKVVDGICRAAGAKRTRIVTHGDFGVIRAGGKSVAAIRSGAFWAVRNEQVAFIGQARLLRAWAI